MHVYIYIYIYIYKDRICYSIIHKQTKPIYFFSLPYTHIHTHTHTHTHAHTHTHMHALTYTYAHTHIPMLTHTHTYARSHTHTYPCLHTHMRTHTHTYARSHTHTYQCSHTHIRALTHTHIHAHTHTHTHTHYSVSFLSFFCFEFFFSLSSYLNSFFPLKTLPSLLLTWFSERWGAANHCARKGVVNLITHSQGVYSAWKGRFYGFAPEIPQNGEHQGDQAFLIIATNESLFVRVPHPTIE